MLCKNCGREEYKLVPAGISKKTGKAYDAFYSCWGCKHTARVNDQQSSGNVVQSNLGGNNDTLEKMREWAGTIEKRLVVLEEKVKVQEGLIREYRGDAAYELHDSLSEIPEVTL